MSYVVLVSNCPHDRNWLAEPRLSYESLRRLTMRGWFVLCVLTG